MKIVETTIEASEKASDSKNELEPTEKWLFENDSNVMAHNQKMICYPASMNRTLKTFQRLQYISLSLCTKCQQKLKAEAIKNNP